MRIFKRLAGSARWRISILLALIPAAMVMGVSYFRRSRAVLPVAVVVRCVDDRYSNNPRLCAKLPYGYCWSWPGCAKEFVENEEQREQFFRQLQELRVRLAKKGKDLGDIILVDHGDCAWYGEADSVENHRANLREAAKLIRRDSRARGLSVKLYFHDLENNALALVEPDDDMAANLLEAS